jgi:hypothetical protein
MKTFITESELKNRVEKLKAYTDIVNENQNSNLEVGKFYLVSDYGNGIHSRDFDSYDEAREVLVSMGGRAYDEYFISQWDGENLKPYEEDDEVSSDQMSHKVDRDAEPEHHSNKSNEFNIGESVGFCNDDSLVRILAITNRVIK